MLEFKSIDRIKYKIGDKVMCLCDNDELRITWGLDYPHRGEILTIIKFHPHINEHMNIIGATMIYFIEKPYLSGQSDINYKGKFNYRLLN